MKIDYRIRKELIRRAAGDRRTVTMWHAYIRFLEKCPLLESAQGTAIHHILWRAEYPQWVKSKWNLIRLSDEDHQAAAALALSAEPKNGILLAAFDCTYRICGSSRSWKPKSPKKLIKMYVQDRHSALKIAKIYGVTCATVRKFLIRSNVCVRNNSEQQRKRIKNLDKILKLYTDRKITSVSDLAKRAKVGIWTMRKILFREGALMPRGGKILWYPKNPQEVINLYVDSTMPVTILAKKLKISPGRLRGFLKRNKIKIRGGSSAAAVRWSKQPWIPKHPKNIMSLYELGWTIERLAKKYSTNVQRVSNFLHKSGVLVRFHNSKT